MHVYNADYYRGDNYPEYFLTPHWEKLKNRHIFTKANARCWICETPVYVFWKEDKRSSNLLIHHVSYINLFHERLYRDIYILCYKCHSRVHKYVLFIFFPITTRLKKRDLIKRMLFLRVQFLIRKRRFGVALWHLLRYIVGL